MSHHLITEPLRLAVGNHAAGSGKGCAMNLISWENGDTTITDLPDCADPMLAKIVQRINDGICTHRDGDLLCPACSMIVLELAHRTVGTGRLPLSDQERLVVWVKVAADQARAVTHLVPEQYRDRAVHAIEAAERWAQDPSSITYSELHNAAAYAAYAYAAAYANAAAYAAYAYAAAAYAANAAAYANAANAAAYANAADAYAAYAYAADYAADANAAAANAADAADAAANAAANAAAAYAADAAVDRTGARLALAHRAFDLYEQLTDHARVAVSAERVAEAYTCMTSSH